MESVLQLAETLMASPWLLLLVIVLAAFDGIAPIVPAETVVITGGAFAITGSPHALLLVLAGATGALLGDLLAHQIGRGAGPLTSWLRSRRRIGVLVESTERALRRRGGTMIITARFIPGGRTAVNVTSGAIGYPRGRFLLFSAIAAVTWALYYVGAGMLGGAAFGDDPLLGVALGIGVALALGGLIELGRRWFGRQDRAAGASDSAQPPTTQNQGEDEDEDESEGAMGALTRRSLAGRGACPGPAPDGS